MILGRLGLSLERLERRSEVRLCRFLDDTLGLTVLDVLGLTVLDILGITVLDVRSFRDRQELDAL